MGLRSVGIIGYGAFGAHVAELVHRFAPDVEVRVHSKRYEPDGTTFFSVEDTCASDAVILCCSIRDFESLLLTW